MVNVMESYSLAFRAIVVISVLSLLFVAALYYGLINP